MAIPLSSAKDLLANLISFDTTSAKTNVPLIDYVKTYLEANGLDCQLVPNDTGEKASLFATIGSGEGGIALSGHTDVVPVTGQNWDSDPFSMTEEGGLLFGRGTADMKGYLACVMAMVPRFVEHNLSRPIHLVFSYDEEVGCTGVRPLIGQLGKRLARPAMVIVGEPTTMRVVDAHKSIHVFSTEVVGKEVHSSVPDLGVNAVAWAARYVCELDRLSNVPELVGENTRFDPPRSTIHVGKINGGTALNIVPKSCRFLWEVRALPGVDVGGIITHLDRFAASEMLPSMHGIFKDASVTTTLCNVVPGFQSRATSEVVPLAMKIAQQNESLAVSYGTEAGLFEEAGIPTVICGPGSIGQAHQPNEFIAVEELAKCLTFLEHLAESC